MSTETQVHADHPLMLAWTAHKATPDYADSKRWAQHADHVDGSLWALFAAGWSAAQTATPAPAAVPLTDAQIKSAVASIFRSEHYSLDSYDRAVARAVEKAHGIAAVPGKGE